MRLTFNDLSLGKKLILILSIIITLVAVGSSLFITSRLIKLKTESVRNELKLEVRLVADMVAVEDISIRKGAEKLSRVFLSFYPGKFSLDHRSTIKVGASEAPVLLYDRRPVNLDFSSVDRFSSLTGGVATIFVRQGDDFLRITTSLKKEDNSTRALGTLLGKTHPAYERLMKGEEYVGKAHLFGRDYMAKYVPIKDIGQVIGILFVGMDFTDEVKTLKEKIRSIKIGKTGYPYILDAREGDVKGNLVVHPAKEGQNILLSQDAKGREFIKEIIDSREGIISYPWLNKEAGETSARDKIVAYTYFEDWKWVVCAGSYIDELVEDSTALRNALIAGTVVVIGIIVLLLNFVIRRLVSQPLAELAHAVHGVSSGDLTLRLEARSNDEVGALTRDTNSMIESLNAMIHSILAASHNVLSTVNALKSHANSSTEGAKKQSEQAAQIATAAEEMSQTITDIAKNASTSSETSSKAMETALQGKDVAEGAVKTIDTVYTSTVELAGMMEKLNSRTSEIGNIVTVINGIAEQTNLLALNAAIEAARAGEQGRGFSVVADEVKKLAERTISATAEISEKIGAVQEESRQTMSSMNGASTEVTRATEYIKQLGDSLGHIVGAVNKTRDEITQIATAVDEQSAASEEVAGNIEKVSVISKDMEKISDQVMVSVTGLVDVSDKLKAATSGFTLRKE